MELGMYQGPQVTQQLNLAPQLLQWLKLLQVPTTELSALVQAELESNPALESDDYNLDESDRMEERESWEKELASGDLAGSDGADLERKFELLAQIDDEWREDYYRNGSDNVSDPDSEQKRHQYMLDCLVADTGLQEHLINQLATLGLAADELSLAELIIGSLDRRGYLGMPLQEMANLTGESMELLEGVLQRVQQMDPPGIAARSLSECILLQLPKGQACSKLAARIAADYLEQLAHANYRVIAAELDVEESQVQEAARWMTALCDPEPGRRFDQQPTTYITPDIRILKTEEGYRIELNNGTIPHLKISDGCRRLLEQARISQTDQSYIRNKLRRAAFLIQGISQRQETLYKVSEQIVRIQGEYFDSSEGVLKPLTMSKVANLIGVHETTVSRAIANKYVETPRGLFEFKHFFRSGYRCRDGSAFTPESVKDMISELIRQEDPAQPLTDLDIVERLLKDRGLRLARRTVAKYRDEMSIPSSKARRVSLAMAS
jgi:RNA polymerase sigma-54 factor